MESRSKTKRILTFLNFGENLTPKAKESIVNSQGNKYIDFRTLKAQIIRLKLYFVHIMQRRSENIVLLEKRNKAQLGWTWLVIMSMFWGKARLGSHHSGECLSMWLPLLKVFLYDQ